MKEYIKLSYVLILLVLPAAFFLGGCKDDSTNDNLLGSPAQTNQLFGTGGTMGHEDLGDIGLVYTTVGDGNITVRYEEDQRLGGELHINPLFTFVPDESTGHYQFGPFKLVKGENTTGFAIEGNQEPIVPGTDTYDQFLSMFGSNVSMRNILDDGTENFSVEFVFPDRLHPFQVESAAPPHESMQDILPRDAVITIGEAGTQPRDVLVNVRYSKPDGSRLTKGLFYEDATSSVQLNPSFLEDIPSGANVDVYAITCNAQLIEGVNGYEYLLAVTSEVRAPSFTIE